MEIGVIYDKCIGCGECYKICPHVFTLDDAGIAQVKTDLPPLDDHIQSQVMHAKKVCPTAAITVKKV